MSRIPGLRRFFRFENDPRRVRDDVDRELAFHFEMTTRDLMNRGLSEEEARRESARRFGDVDATRERLTAIDHSRVGRERRVEWWQGFGRDVRYAIRGLRRKPGFTLGVVVTLALGIGANATMFGVIDRLLLRPPAYMKDPDHTQRLYYAQTSNSEEFISSNTGYRVYQQVVDWTSSFDRVAAFFFENIAVGTGDQAREQRVGLVSASYWSFFDARPALGRYFASDEDRPPEGAPVAVLGYGFWQSRYAGSADVIGKTIDIGRRLYTIIGVAPKGFTGTSLETAVAFVPITAGVGDLFGGFGRGDPSRWYTSHDMRWLEVIAHRKPSVTIDAAAADATNAYRRSWTEMLTMRQGRGTALEAARPRAIVASILAERGPNQGSESKVATWLAGVAAMVLLIACANVANLLLARALRRRREIAVRLALGVGRARLLAQLLTESLLLALIGGGGGLLVAQWGGGLLRAAFLDHVDLPNVLADPHMLVFAGILALVVGVLTGIAPALQSSRSDVAASLKAGSREGTFHRSRFRTSLLVGQAALSVVLLTGAGLFVRSLRNVNSVHLGYDPDHVLLVMPSMRGVKLDSAAAAQLRDRLLERARALPQVAQASRTVSVPFYMTVNQPIFVPGVDTAQLNKLDVAYHAGDPEYFETMGTRIVRGRGFTSADRVGAPSVIVVSQGLAKALWPNADALGRCMRVGADTMPCNTVVGIAEDIRRSLEGESGLQYYLPSAQRGANSGQIFIRTRGEAREQSEVVRRELQRLMPGASYVNVRSLRDVLQPNFRPWQLGATMFSIFGALALVLAAVGLYSVIAYTVTQRTHEMGVRVALGAQAGDVVRLVVKEGVVIAIAGIALGTVVVLLTARYLTELLFGVPARDPLTIGAVALILLAVSVVACVVPARRAAGVDPNVALRTE
jgi:putative ABC transport system permease protein